MPARPSSRTPAGSPVPTRYLWRAGACAAGLLLLWTLGRDATQPPRPADTVVYSDDAGATAASVSARPPAGPTYSLISWGNAAALLLLVGGGALAWRLQRRQRGGAVEAGAFLEPLGRLALAPQQDLRLVACGETILLLGVTAGQISCLHTFTRAEVEAHLDASPTEPARTGAQSAAPTTARAATPPAGGDFGTLLRQMTSRRAA